jgi:glycosyltransferase involved in cell wall biosynthesis
MKVLHIAHIDRRSGVASFIMNYYRYINKEKIHFDFLSNSLTNDNFSNEIKRLGGNIYNTPNYKKNIFKYIIYTNKVISNGYYDIIHCHDFLVSIIPLFIARINGIKVRIIHSHGNFNASLWKRLLVYFFRNFWNFFATDFFACSIEAAHFLFGRRYKYIIINNAIEVERYIFNDVARNIIRNNLHLSENDFVIGYIARFEKGKNHFFLIDVFLNIVEKYSNAYLLLIGDGLLRDTLKNYVNKLNISKNVLFYGISKNVYDLYSAMDLFVFPSLFEGLGLVGIEAQCAGLPVIASLNIPKAMQITPLVHWLDLQEGPKKWAEKAIEYSISSRKRMNMNEIITKNGYNIKNEAKKLEGIYENSILYSMS